MQYLVASVAIEPCHGITRGIDPHVSQVQLARWVWEHGQHIFFPQATSAASKRERERSLCSQVLLHIILYQID